MSFSEKLDRVIEKNNSLLCIGLDSEKTKLPSYLQNDPTPQFTFNKAIIDATQAYVCAYKPNSAFYEGEGERGLEELKMTCDYLHTKYPSIPIILDAKRADIGNTNKGYLAYAYDYLQVDAITLHPYLGAEALRPFLNRGDKGAIILCRTSNPGAGEFQDLPIAGEPLYKIVAKKVAHEWNTNKNCLLVVGATYPKELAEIRALAEDMTFLVPGIGAQGGDIQKTVQAGINAQGKGIIISASRSIIFASGEKNFAEAAQKEARTLCESINSNRV
jgi:orotidine-5'-phosphate decarboxylase